MRASGRSHFTLRAAISASSAATVTLSCLPAMFMPTVNSSAMVLFCPPQVGRTSWLGLFELREPHLQDLLLRHSPVAAFRDQNELLRVGQAGGNHHLPAGSELVEQGRRNEVRSSGHDHLVERGVLRPAMIAIADFDLNVGEDRKSTRLNS